ncbi:MAG: right-handed parallel beta-helix repeat-containing protein [Acidimicrobiaceae bacterium]|nr:right-handed parallel beta-helix repeat-containing protein [Acidimicrobiaceae bacterium]
MIIGVWDRIAATAAAFAILTSCSAHPAPVQSIQKQFYVDASAGNDSWPGTEPRPWRTLAKVSAFRFQPGDTILLRRGDTYTGQLTLDDSGTASQPVTVGAYGAGSRPVVTGTAKVGVTMSANHVDVSQLTIRDSRTVGVMVTGDDDRLRDLRVTKNAEGIEVAASVTGTRISGSWIAHNQKMEIDTPGGNDDHGANGVVIKGTNTRVSDNFFARDLSAHSYDYGRDGAAVEIYGAQNTVVENNIARDELAFSEVGGHSNNTTFTNNGLVSRVPNGAFVLVHGRDTFGPNYGTHLIGNKALLTGTKAIGVWCSPGCDAAMLDMTRNVIALTSSGTPAYVAVKGDGSIIAAAGGGNNTYWGGDWVGIIKSPGDTFSGVWGPKAPNPLVDGGIRVGPVLR